MRDNSITLADLNQLRLWMNLIGGVPAFNFTITAMIDLCPFCTLPSTRIWFQEDSTQAFYDGYPISPGHTLVVPRRHVASVFDLPSDELGHLWENVRTVRGLLKEQFHPEAFNIGLNDGEAAGQTVMHAHIHVVPRYLGDIPDPRGGIRWILPEKAPYWSR